MNEKKVEYPLYDVPWLVRDANEYRMSAKRHEIELRNQAVVDDYFIARANGIRSPDAKKKVAEKHKLSVRRVGNILVWFWNEARKRKKYDFLQKFSLSDEH